MIGKTDLLFSASVLLLIPALLSAQFYPIRGFVTDASSGEPLPVASTVIQDSNLGATTNLDGFFVINHVPAGSYTLVASYLGYSSEYFEIEVTGEDIEPMHIELQPSAVRLKTAEVTVKKEETEDYRDKPIVSTVPVNSELIRMMPSLGGEMDVLRALQTIPGVKASSDISSALHVRGGSPDQTLILMDHNTVYNPSHMFGLFSTFNADAVKHLNLFKGAFPAQFGGRSGSVLEVVMNDGNRKKSEGLASIGLISARASIEGPLPKESGSYAASYRRTYLDFAVDMARKSGDMDLPDYYFYDSNAKINLDLTDRTTLTLGGYWGNDRMNFDFGSEDARMNAYLSWGNRTLSTRLRHALGRTSYISVGAAISRYRSKWGFATEDIILDEARERITEYSLKTNYQYFGIKDHQIKTGIWYSLYDTHFWEQNEDMVFVDIDTSAHNLSWYIQDVWRINSFYEVQPGIRLYYHNAGDQFAVDPRLAMIYRYSPNIRFKAGGGRYTQWVIVASGGGEMSAFDIWFPLDDSVEPCYTNQAVLGFEWDTENGYEFTTEVYYTDMHNVVEFRPMTDEGDRVVEAFVNGDGYASGIEWMIRRKKGRWNGWIGYSLSWTERKFSPESHINEGEWYFPKWDRRHDFTAVANYKLSRSWDFSGSWRLNTGQGFTQGLGVYTQRYIGFYPDDRGNYDRGILMGGKNNYRFPEDHRLDLSAMYNHLFFKMPAKLTISVYNAYSRRSYWMRTFDKSSEQVKVTDVKLLPIIPLVNYEVRF